MTYSARYPMIALLALTLTLAATPGPTPAETRVGAQEKPTAQTNLAPRRATAVKGFVAFGPGTSGADDDGWCGNGEILVIYDEDANGDPIPGTEVYGCVED